MRFFIAFTIWAVLPFSGHAQANNPELVRQFSADMRALMKIQNPKLDVPLTDEAIESAIATAEKKIEREHPSRFATSASETRLLAEGKNVITDEELKSALQERRDYKTILPFPPLLDYYQALQATSGLNQYQRLLAFRVARDALESAERRDEIQSKIKKNES